MRQPRSASRALSRRSFLATSGAATLSAGLAACSLSPEKPGGQSGNGGAAKGKESPALAGRVKNGDLPPVAKRLPEKPLLVKPANGVGTYGGTWHTVMLGPSDDSWLDRAVGYEYLLRWKPETVAHTLDDIIPNIAQSYEANADGTEYTFHLRPGMRWSDGQPYTSDDIVFAVHDVYLNTKLYPVAPLGLLSGDQPATVKKIDDYTVTFVFPKPSSLFPHFVASKNSGLSQLGGLPKHYLKQFHADYNPDVDSIVKKEKVSDWVELFSQKTELWTNAELPRVHAWLPTKDLGTGETFVLERNPYYWKVDPEGSQLPYIDTFSNDLISDAETMVLKATHGDIDMYDRLINTLQNKPVLARSRSEGEYHFFDLTTGIMNAAIISFNLTHKDPTKRKIFQNRDFRIGLSYAIDRQEIIKTVYKSLGEPWQAAPLPGSTYFDEELAKQYTEHSPELANKFLDRAGYRRQGGSGPRIGPDGKPITFLVEIATRDYGLDWASVMELVKQYWQNVGIHIDVRSEDVSLLYTRKDANQHDAVVWLGDVGGLDPHLDPRYLFPNNHESNYAELWMQWYESFGKEGEKPPAATRRQMDLYTQFKQAMDKHEQTQLMGEITKISREQFYTIGISRPTGRYGIDKNDFRNVPNNYLEGSNYPNPGPTNPEQYFVST